MENKDFLNWIRNHPKQHHTLQRLGEATGEEVCELLIALEQARLKGLILYVMTSNCWNVDADRALKTAWLDYLGDHVTEDDLHRLVSDVVIAVTSQRAGDVPHFPD